MTVLVRLTCADLIFASYESRRDSRMKRQYYSSGVRGQDTRSRDAVPEAGASMAIVETRASGVARPIAIAVNTRYPTCVYTGAPTAVTGVQKMKVLYKPQMLKE